MESNETLYNDALKKFGKSRQSIIAMEELSELQKEISKFLRDKGDSDHLAEEVADVEIMIEQLKQFYDISNEVFEWKRKKLARLAKIIHEWCNLHALY